MFQGARLALRKPSTRLSLIISAGLVFVWAFLRVWVFKDEVFPLTYLLPLLICGWTRNRRLLWGMVVAFVGLATIKHFWFVEESDLSRSDLTIIYGATLMNILLGGVIVYLLIVAMDQSERLNADLSKHERILMTLLRSVSSPQSERQVLDDVCRCALELLGDSAMAAAILERQNDRVFVRSYCTLRDAGQFPDQYPFRDSFAERVIRVNGPVCTENVLEYSDIKAFSASYRIQFQSILGSPVRIGLEPVGLICICFRGAHTCTAERLHVAEWLANQCSLALETVRFRNDLERCVAERTLESERRATQLRRLTSELTIAEERERRRLSHVLHDGLQQFLVAAKFRLVSAASGRNAQKEISELSALIDDAIETSRSLSAELSPPTLGSGRLGPSLEWLARWMQEKHGLTVNVTMHDEVQSVSDEMITLLFQSVRELLFNVVKHARTQVATVNVQRLGNRILIEVEDQGIGFDPAILDTSYDTSRGIGLIGIRERLDYLGGSLEIDSDPGRGSRFRLFSPPLYYSDEIRSIPAMPVDSPLR